MVFSVCAPFIGLGMAKTETSAAPFSAGVSVEQHKITAAELQTYKDTAGTKENQTYNQPTVGYGTGLTPPKAEEWNQIAQNAYVIEKIDYQATLPAQVDLSATQWFPPIGSQGQQGSCASFATGYYCKTYQEAKEHNWDLTSAVWTGGADNCSITAAYQGKVMSPAFVYNLINGGEDVGSDLETPIRLVCNVGISSWETMPYHWQNFTQWPTQAAWAEAPLYRSDPDFGYHYLYTDTSAGLDSLKEWLAAGNLAVIAVDATDNLWNYTTHSIALGSQDLITYDSYTVGWLDHAGTIVGYDDQFTYTEQGQTRQGAIKIANSWGKGGWENVADGCYWISYAAFMKLSASDNPVITFQNLDGYQPQILASFNLSHQNSGDCNIVFGYGSPQVQLATKNFSAYVVAGNRPFCTNNVIFDISEFKAYLTSNYYAPFFMQVYDSGVGEGGTSYTGTVNYFAVGNTTCTQTMDTANSAVTSLSLTHSFGPSSLVVSPASGQAQAQLTLKGTGMTESTVDIAYFNPVTQQWVSIVNDYAVSTNFSFTTQAPDLRQNSPAGDNPQASNPIVFRVQDGIHRYNDTYTELRRGLTSVGGMTAECVFGNGTDLSSHVFVQNGQALSVTGVGFKSGSAVLLWDGENVGSATANALGMLSCSATVPATSAGKHTLTVSDRSSNVSVTVTRLPTVANNASAAWQTGDFTVNLTPDYAVAETYYKINGGSTQTVSGNGQPRITVEGAGNTLEYWSSWSVYGSANMELAHTILTGLKLDKTAPSASIVINGGAASATSGRVTLALGVEDGVSGVKQVRFSNDAAFIEAAWEPLSASKTWQLGGGEGAKTVYFQVEDNAGLTATVSSQITVVSSDSASPTPTPTTPATPAAAVSQSANPTVAPTLASTPAVPEFTAPIALFMVVLLTATVLAAAKTRTKSIG